MSSILFVLTSFAIVLLLLVFDLFVAGYIPNSLSESFYALKKNSRDLGFLFQVCLALAVLALMPAWLEASPESIEFLAFLSCGSTLFVAAAPNYEDKSMEYKVHMTAAVICCTCGVLWCLISGAILTTLAIFAAGAMVWQFVSKPHLVLIVEIATLVSVYIAILLVS